MSIESALNNLEEATESFTKKLAEGAPADAEQPAAEPSFSQRHPGLVATAQVFGGIFALVAVATAAATVGSRVGMIGASKNHPLYKS